MRESTTDARTSRLAEKSSFWGVFALLLLLICGLIVFQAIHAATTGLEVWQRGPIHISRLADICAVAAGVAAIAALVLGILGLVEVRQGAGKVKGTSQAVAGLVTGTLTLLPLMSVLLVAIFGVPGQQKLESSNNLKALGLAMMIHHENCGRFPPAVLRDRELSGQAQPYSWRVALLPILGEDELYSQYRRDEPWDSPANKAVLARMPSVFALPGSARAAEGLTHYQVLVGPGTAFERPEEPVRLWSIPRGADQTILVVEAADPVFWTKPVDLSYTSDGPLPKVGGLVGNGFHALFADGSVRWIEAEQQERALRSLVPRKDDKGGGR
jgi:prepilin-type processing-associated H-X9-DG protein